MSENYVRNKNKITARRWYTDIDLNITPHPSSGDLVLKQDKEYARPDKGERIKIKGYLEDFALSKKEADELIMTAREIAYKD